MRWIKTVDGKFEGEFFESPNKGAALLKANGGVIPIPHSLDVIQEDILAMRIPKPGISELEMTGAELALVSNAASWEGSEGQASKESLDALAKFDQLSFDPNKRYLIKEL